MGSQRNFARLPLALGDGVWEALSSRVLEVTLRRPERNRQR